MPAAARDLRTCADSDLIDMDACKFFLLPILFYFSHELFLSQVFFLFSNGAVIVITGESYMQRYEAMEFNYPFIQRL